MFPWEDISSSVCRAQRDEQQAGAGIQHFGSKPACRKSLGARSAAAPRAAARALRLVAAAGAPRVLATTTIAVGALGSVAVGPAAPVVAQAAAPTPRAAAAPRAGAAAGGDWGWTWGWALGGTLGRAFGRRTLRGGALGRGLALLLVLLAGHLGRRSVSLGKTKSPCQPGIHSPVFPHSWFPDPSLVRPAAS